MSKNDVEKIINTSINIKSERTLENIFMAGVEEVGELSKVLRIPSHGEDGVVGECVDVMLTIVDLATQDLVSRGYHGADKIIDEWCRMMETQWFTWMRDVILYSAEKLFMVVTEAIGGISVDLRIKSGIKNRPVCKDGILDKCITAYLSVISLTIRAMREQGFRDDEAMNELDRVVDAKLAKWVSDK